MIKILEAPYIVNPRHNKWHAVNFRSGITLADALYDCGAINNLNGLGFTELVATVNGYPVLDWTRVLVPGDQVSISVAHGDPIFTPIFISWGMSASWAAFAASVTTSMLLMGAGLLINTLMAPSIPNVDQGNNKPSYGWSGVRNETAPGDPVPVVYGRPWSGPKIIGSYRTVGADFTMWQYLLLCVSAGKTNNILTENNIMVGEELLTAFSDYTFAATDGSTAITATTRNALADFNKVHHDRIFDKRIKFDSRSQIDVVGLLHFNLPEWAAGTVSVGDFIVPTTLNGYCYECTTGGATGASEPAAWDTTPGNTTADGATVVWTTRAYTAAPVLDSSGRDAPWTKTANAQIKFDTPKFGNGYLNLPADGDYISTDDLEVLRLDYPSQIEFWFRLPDLTDRVIFGQQISYPGYENTIQSVMAVGYKNGTGFYLQSSSGVGANIGAVTSWQSFLNTSGASSPTLNTWYYCRIQAYDDGYQVLIEQGAAIVLLASAPKIEGYSVHNPVEDRSSTVIPYGDETATEKGYYSQQIGMGYYFSPAAGTMTQQYGRCDIDEFRATRGLADDYDDLTLPVAELPTPTEIVDPFVIRTRSKVDTVRLIIEFPQGLFRQNDTGVGRMQIAFGFDYRAVGDVGAWTTSTKTYSARSTSPVRFQKTIALPARDQYDIRITRTTAEAADENTERSESFLISFEEIIDLALYYPGLQMIALGIKASESRSGQIGAIRVHHNRTEITVPSWDGLTTQDVDATVPMWQWFDGATNAHYGAKIDPTTLIQSEHEEWESWTNELTGGYRRAESHLVFDEPGSVSDTMIKHVEQGGRARIMQIGSYWGVIVDKPRESNYIFSGGNIIRDSFAWETYEKPEKSDAVEVAFWDSTRNGARNSVMAKASWYDSLTRSPKIAQIEIRSIITAEQAAREAQLRINKNEYVKRHGKHRARIGSAFCETGDVCTIIPTVSKYAFGGLLRVDHAASNILHIDQVLNLSVADFNGKLKAFVYAAFGDGYQEYDFDVLGPWGEDTSDILISGNITADRGDIFGLGRPTEDRLVSQIVRKVINVKERNVDFEWCQYDERVFEDPITGLIL